MRINIIKELEKRGLIQDIMPGTEDQLLKEMTACYVGFDPTAESLHIGSMLPIILLMHLQKAGHKPYALIGGATGMIGDPTGKSAERNLLDEDTLNKNIKGIQKQLSQFLNFDSMIPNAAEIINNYDWMKDFSFLHFIRDVGKHISVNYMMAKDSVQRRLEFGLSFTEFSYQLLQGYDFLHLYQTKNIKLQFGGADQWGNITTGTELIRRKVQGEGYAFTCPLLKKADGGKFGKTEGGNIWLDRNLTSPFKFYQYWLNVSDEDAKNLIKVFTFLPIEEIEDRIKQHDESPHLRQLQKKLAEEMTILVHSEEDLIFAQNATNILFGNATKEMLAAMNEEQLLQTMDGVPSFIIKQSELQEGKNMIDLLVEGNIYPSKGEARKALLSNAVSVNKEKWNNNEATVNTNYLLFSKYILLQKGKKNYYLGIVD